MVLPVLSQQKDEAKQSLFFLCAMHIYIHNAWTVFFPHLRGSESRVGEEIAKILTYAEWYFDKVRKF